MNTTPLRIHRAEDGDIPGVLALLREHMPATDVAARHAWLYRANPDGRAVTVIAYDEASGEPAGITSVFPRRVLVQGKTRLGSIGGDAFVPPRFRRRGIATALHVECMRLMERDGVEFMYGPPEPLNLRALVKAGSRIITNVCRYARPRIVQRAARKVARALASRRAELVPVGSDDRNVHAIWERVSDTTKKRAVVPIRDAAHYAWRYASPAGAQRAYVLLERGQPLAVCAVEHDGSRVAMVDLFAAAEDYAKAAFLAASLLPEGAVSVQLNAQGAPAKALWKAGFVAREEKPFQVLAVRKDEDPKGALFSSDDWFYTWGDGDVDQLFDAPTP
jgi:GNAT superfamily N-acetyltransferase